jgi:hypothetical protein
MTQHGRRKLIRLWPSRKSSQLFSADAEVDGEDQSRQTA